MIDLDPEARRVLALAREARTPSEDDKQRVARRLAVGLGASVVAGAAGAAAQGAGAGASAAKAAGTAALLKWWIAGGAIVVTAIGAYAGLSSNSRQSAPRVRAAAVAPAQAPRSSEPAKAIEALAGEPAPAVLVEKTSPHPVQSRRRSATAASSLPAELELLHEAQSAWRAHDARGALSLLESHRARYPRSSLRAEREGLQVLSLCELGRKAEAARLAQRLLARAPQSPMRAAIEQSCALK